MPCGSGVVLSLTATLRFAPKPGTLSATVPLTVPQSPAGRNCRSPLRALTTTGAGVPPPMLSPTLVKWMPVRPPVAPKVNSKLPVRLRPATANVTSVAETFLPASTGIEVALGSPGSSRFCATPVSLNLTASVAASVMPGMPTSEAVPSTQTAYLPLTSV